MVPCVRVVRKRAASQLRVTGSRVPFPRGTRRVMTRRIRSSPLHNCESRARAARGPRGRAAPPLRRDGRARRPRDAHRRVASRRALSSFPTPAHRICATTVLAQPRTSGGGAKATCAIDRVGIGSDRIMCRRVLGHRLPAPLQAAQGHDARQRAHVRRDPRGKDLLSLNHRRVTATSAPSRSCVRIFYLLPLKSHRHDRRPRDRTRGPPLVP